MQSEGPALMKMCLHWPDSCNRDFQCTTLRTTIRSGAPSAYHHVPRDC